MFGCALRYFCLLGEVTYFMVCCFSARMERDNTVSLHLRIFSLFFTRVPGMLHTMCPNQNGPQSVS
jgi:hypothetical protein